ncbi:MAG: DUF4032 domain-containing protein [Actinomycetota bacterium]
MTDLDDGSVSIITRGGHPDFLDLPWDQPLAEWDHPRLVKMAHGISRHVVRFVRYDDRVYALKETGEVAARAEYDVLVELRSEHLPTVEPVGVVTESHAPGGATLITRYLDFSLPYWYLLGREGPALADKLIDAGVVLMVRLHLEHVYWGDCSLSNTLFRRDAGALMAYLVDAETSERSTSMSDQMREHDVDIARENIAGGLLNLQADGRVDDDVDPFAIADEFAARYEGLWDELTRLETYQPTERWRIDKRIRHLNELGFDVEELAIKADGSGLRVRPILVEEGHHSRELRKRTGLEVQENQARRLLADIASFRAYLETTTGRRTPAAVAAARWLAEVYEPAVEAIPDAYQTRLEPAEVFHHLLEHRYYLSEREGRGVPTPEALEDYLTTVLPAQPDERQLQVDPAADPDRT